MPLRPQERKALGAFIGTCVVGATAFLTIRGIVKAVRRKKAKDASQDALENEYRQAEIEAIGKSDPSVRKNLSDAQAKSIADTLYSAMAGWGTEEDIIESEFEKIMSYVDFMAVSRQFGTPRYSEYGAPLFSWMNADELTLTGWLKKECSGSLLTSIKSKFAQWGQAF